MHTWPQKERLKLVLGMLVPGAYNQTNFPGNSLKNWYCTTTDLGLRRAGEPHQPGEGAVMDNLPVFVYLTSHWG